MPGGAPGRARCARRRRASATTCAGAVRRLHRWSERPRTRAVAAGRREGRPRREAAARTRRRLATTTDSTAHRPPRHRARPGRRPVRPESAGPRSPPGSPRGARDDRPDRRPERRRAPAGRLGRAPGAGPPRAPTGRSRARPRAGRRRFAGPGGPRGGHAAARVRGAPVGGRPPNAPRSRGVPVDSPVGPVRRRHRANASRADGRVRDRSTDGHGRAKRPHLAGTAGRRRERAPVRADAASRQRPRALAEPPANTGPGRSGFPPQALARTTARAPDRRWSTRANPAARSQPASSSSVPTRPKTPSPRRSRTASS